MARTVNEQEYAIKRNEILDVTQRLVYTKGYEQMAIRDILNEIQISKGAFYHYFDSKQALLEAMIERMQQQLEQLLVAAIEDPSLPALEKLQHFFDVAGHWKTAHKDYVMALLAIWYTDDNAIVRQKVLASMIRHAAPWLTQIINQGVIEGAFVTPFPDQVGTILLSLTQAMGDQFAGLILSTEPRPIALAKAEQTVAACNHSIERLLGASEGSLSIIDAETLREWFV